MTCCGFFERFICAYWTDFTVREMISRKDAFHTAVSGPCFMHGESVMKSRQRLASFETVYLLLYVFDVRNDVVCPRLQITEWRAGFIKLPADL